MKSGRASLGAVLLLGLVLAAACGDDPSPGSRDGENGGAGAGGSETMPPGGAGSTHGGASGAAGSSDGGNSEAGAGAANGGAGASGVGEAGNGGSDEAGSGGTGAADGSGGVGGAGEGAGGAGEGGDGCGALGCGKVCGGDAGVIEVNDAEALSVLARRECEVIVGSLALVAPDITSVDGLESIRAIEGNLSIVTGGALANLRGLAGLEQIGGSLVVQNNPNLLDLTGLESVRALGRSAPDASLVVAGNAKLTSLAALSAAEVEAGASLIILSNPMLVGLTGLSGITAVDSMIAAGNERLSDLAGLTALRRAESMVVAGQPELLAIELPALEQGGDFTFSDNAHLATLRLARLTAVDTDLSINGNAELVSVELNGLERVGTLTIASNPVLRLLALEALAEASSLLIAGNGALPQCEVDALDARLGGVCGVACSGNDTSAVCP